MGRPIKVEHKHASFTWPTIEGIRTTELTFRTAGVMNILFGCDKVQYSNDTGELDWMVPALVQGLETLEKVWVTEKK